MAEQRVDSRLSRPSVSVVIPIYRYASYLCDALESVCRQTILRRVEASRSPGFLEVLLVIDGECDGVEESIPEAVRPYLRTFRIPHRGVSAARNHALANARATIAVAFLDADDFWHPEKLDKQIALLKQNSEIGAIYSNSIWIDQGGQALRRTQKDQYGGLPSGRIARRLLERNYIITSSLLVHRKVIDKVGGFDDSLKVCEDWDFNIRVARDFDVVAIDDPLTYYRLHAQGSHYQLDAMRECGYQLLGRHWWELGGGSPRTLNRLKANISISLGGSSLYSNRPAAARRFLLEAFRLHKSSRLIYLLFILSLFPPKLRDIIFKFRDRFSFLP